MTKPLVDPFTSVVSQKLVGEFSGRGARIARREQRAHREYVSDEQRREAGCPARKMTTSFWDTTLWLTSICPLVNSVTLS